MIVSLEFAGPVVTNTVVRVLGEVFYARLIYEGYILIGGLFTLIHIPISDFLLLIGSMTFNRTYVEEITCRLNLTCNTAFVSLTKEK